MMTPYDPAVTARMNYAKIAVNGITIPNNAARNSHFLTKRFPKCRCWVLFLVCCLGLSQYSWANEPFVLDKAMLTLPEDNLAAMALVNRLQSPNREERIPAIDEVITHPEAATPPVLYSLANALASEHRLKEAAFWYHVGKMRVMYDIRRNRDQSLGDVPQVLAMRLVKTVLQAVYFSDPEGTLDVVKSAIAWDNAHAHSYNPLWPTPHGLGVFKNGEHGLAPEKDWAAINEAVHVQWLNVMSKVVADSKAKQLKPSASINADAVH
jgi:hypothetical protein